MVFSYFYWRKFDGDTSAANERINKLTLVGNLAQDWLQERYFSLFVFKCLVLGDLSTGSHFLFTGSQFPTDTFTVGAEKWRGQQDAEAGNS